MQSRADRLHRIIIAVCLVCFALGSQNLIAQVTPPETFPADKEYPGLDQFLTVAEASDFQATSYHEQVIALLDKIAQQSKLATRLEMGRTHEDREIPLIVFSNPPVKNAEEARKQIESGNKLLVLLLGDIHAGEVAGKEALLMLARELATEEDHPLLNYLIIAIAPIYNADGNDRFETGHRPSQVGPEQGMGQRTNAMGLDLNRDFIKLEAPETQSLMRFVRQWNPDIFIDTHTTNGSFHQYLITYAGPKVPAGNPDLIKYVRWPFFYQVSQRLEKRTGYKSFFYGNFNNDQTKWTTFPAYGRYSSNYIGLRNRIGILCEAYSHAPYKDRVLGSLEFVRATLDYASENADVVRHIIDEANKATHRGWSRMNEKEGVIALRSEARAARWPNTVAGYELTEVDGRIVPTDQTRDYKVELWNEYKSTKSVKRPWAYVIPKELAHIRKHLQKHGIEVLDLREDRDLFVENYVIKSIQKAEQPFQKHHLVTIEVEPEWVERQIKAGDWIVRTDQDLGSLASYLLEPESEDGLVTWNFLDDALNVGSDYPIVRVMKDPSYPLLTTPTRPFAEDRTLHKRVTFRSRGVPNFHGSAIHVSSWIDDEHYLENRGGELRVVEALTGYAKPFHEPYLMADALAELDEFNEGTAKNIAKRTRFTMTSDRSAALIQHKNDLYYATFDGSKAVRLTDTPDIREQTPILSPNGQYVAYVIGNDLYAVDVETQTQRPLTTGGTDLIRNGRAAWVYYEEVFGRSWRTFWWSPDSTHVAYLQMDSTNVPEFMIVDDREVQQRVRKTRFPKPGQQNPIVKLGVVSVEGGPIRWVDTTEYDEGETNGDLLITRVHWANDQLIYYIQNRIQTWLDIHTESIDGSNPIKLLRDTNAGWVDPPPAPRFLNDGTFLLFIERSGYRHIYHFDHDGELINAVTDGEWDVRSINRIDEKNSVLYFSATRDNPIGQNFYRVNLDGTNLQRMESEPGTHRVSVSPDGTYFVDSWSNKNQPTQVVLRRTEDGSTVRTLDTNPVYAIEEYDLAEEEHVQIKTDDGFLLEAIVVKPVDFDPNHKYPVWYTTYAGPKAPSIRDTWSSGRMEDQRLASDGFVLFHCDPRSASRRGGVSAWAAYKQLGVQETKDIETAIHWLTSHPWIDADRVGMSGHSYGGYITAYAMTHTNLFAAGIAGSPVTDWRDYDTIYTERYMQTPELNPAGYDAASVLVAAGNLHGRLLLVHGSRDDNVHVQHTLRLAKALQSANKPFEIMIYPDFHHGIWGQHYSDLKLDFIRRTLGEK